MPITLGAYLPLAVILPSSSPARSTSMSVPLSGSRLWVPSIRCRPARNVLRELRRRGPQRRAGRAPAPRSFGGLGDQLDLDAGAERQLGDAVGAARVRALARRRLRRTARSSRW